jgi:hypothetical protein
MLFCVERKLESWKPPYFIPVDLNTLNNFEDTMKVIMPSLGPIHNLSMRINSSQLIKARKLQRKTTFL